MLIAGVTRRFIFGLFAVALLGATVYGQKGLEKEKGFIVGERERARARVEFTHRIFSPTSRSYNTATLLYEDLRAAFHDWITAISLAIESDNLKTFKDSKEFKAKSTNVVRAEKEFMSYFDDLLKTPESAPARSEGQRLFGIAPAGDDATKTPKVSDVIKHGREIADFFEKMRGIFRKDPEREKKWLEFRRDLAAKFESDTKWSTWKEIVSR